MNSPIIVAVSEERSPDQVRRTLTLDGGKRVVYQIRGDVLPPAVDLCDFAAVATIFHAMRERRPLHIDGPVSTTLLRNLEEFQEAWAMWHPSRYAPIAVTAAQECEESAASPRRNGVFAFSGGVDSAAALLRHYSGDLHRRAVTPVAAVMVHGFDIPLSATSAFDTARGAAETSLKEFRVPLCVVRTDWRETICRHWEMEFAAGLAACLHQFAGAATVGIVGSDEDYARLVLPWGSNPITNHLLSGAAFAIQTECSALSRTERVALAARYPQLATRLRVCWQEASSGRNCGRCEKCLRTQLNFLAAGLEPLCFDGRPTPRQVLGIAAKNAVQIAYLEEIAESARARGIEASWLSALTVSIVKNKALLPYRSVLNRVRAGAKRALHRAPLSPTH
jgi:hypothetical protein